MGYNIPTRDNYAAARKRYSVTQSTGVTRQAEIRASTTGKLNELVDPAVNPLRVSTIRLNPREDKRWVVTVGCPMDIEVSVDTTASMGGEVDIAMDALPDLSEAVAKVLPGYDPQLCLGIFGDYTDRFVLCRPQFEMESDKIVRYLKEMVPQRGGGANNGEDPQYAMFARAYLTNAYTNRIGLKGYHFIVTDEPCHMPIEREQIQRIFGEQIFENELAGVRGEMPNRDQVVQELKAKTHQFVLVRNCGYGSDYVLRSWQELCGKQSVVLIDTTRALPQVISALIGLTEGTLSVGDLSEHLGRYATPELLKYLSGIDLGAQAKLRHALPQPIPQKGDIFAQKGDLWPVERASTADTEDETDAVTAKSGIRYL